MESATEFDVLVNYVASNRFILWTDNPGWDSGGTR